MLEDLRHRRALQSLEAAPHTVEDLINCEVFLNDPSFCPLHMSSPSPDALRNSGLVDLVLQVSDRSRIAPRNWTIDCDWRGWNRGRVHWGLTLAKTVWVHPGDVISPRTTVPHVISPRTTVLPPPMLHPIALQWSKQAGRGLIQQKQNREAHLQFEACQRLKGRLRTRREPRSGSIVCLCPEKA